MKRFFTFFAALMLFVVCSFATKLIVPKIPHISVSVERNGSALSNGATIAAGNVLKITYTADDGYRIKENQLKSVVKTVTVTNDDLFEDLTAQINGGSQGFTSVTSSKPYETYVTSGWMINMPNRNAGTGSKTLTYTYTGTGSTTLTFARGLNSYFFQYGSFRFYFYINGSEIYTPHCYYMANPFSGEYGMPLVYDTITFNATGNDKLEWVCEKTANSGWADDSGRTFYVGQVTRKAPNSNGNYTVKIIEAEEGTPIDPESILTLNIPQIPHVSIVVKRGSETLANGARVIIGDQLTITYTAEDGYVIKENGQTTLTKTVTVTGTGSAEVDMTYDIDGESQYYTMLDGTKRYFTKVTPENSFGNSDPNDSIPFWPMERGWLVNMPPYSYSNDATATAVLSYTYTGTGDTKISSIMNISTCCGTTTGGYGAFKLYVKLDGTMINSTLHDFTVKPSTFDSLMFDTISFNATGNNKIEWVCEKTHKGSWKDPEGRPFFVGYIKTPGKGKVFVVESVEAEVKRVPVVVEFLPAEHAKFDYANLDGVQFTGGEAILGSTLQYSFSIADRGYSFDDNGLQYMASVTLNESMVNADNKIVISSKPTIVMPAYTLKIEEQPHAVLRSFKLNEVDTTTDVEVYRYDYLQLEFATEEGFWFCTSKDTVYTTKGNVYNFISMDNVITFNVPTVCVAPPILNIRVLDKTSAEISWTGDFEQYKLFVVDNPIEGNLDYQKGAISLTDNEYVATGLVADHKYYVYLQGLGDVNSEWVTSEFVTGGDACKLKIHMMDSYGDGWNGNKLRFIEGADTTLFTLSGGENTEYYNSFGDTLRVEWVKGNYADEVGFEIYDWQGNVLLSADYNSDEASNFADGETLLERVICEPDPDQCYARIKNLSCEVSEAGDTYTVKWVGKDAVSYDVVIIQNASPTYSDLDSIVQNTTNEYFSFQAKKFHLYSAYVKPVCANGEIKDWDAIFVYDKDTALASHADTVECAIPIALDSQHRGVFAEDALWSRDSLMILYTFVLTDSTNVAMCLNVETTTDDSYNDPIIKLINDKGELLMMEYGECLQTTLAPGTYYTAFMYAGLYNMVHIIDYVVTLKKRTQEVVLTPIELDFMETTDFTGGVPWYFRYNNSYVKGYKFSVADSTGVLISIGSETTQDVYFVFGEEAAPDEYHYDNNYYTYHAYTLEPGNYVIYACGYDTVKMTDKYTLVVKKFNLDSLPAINAKLIEPSILIQDTLKADDVIILDYLYYGTQYRSLYPAHVYEAVLKDDGHFIIFVDNIDPEQDETIQFDIYDSTFNYIGSSYSYNPYGSYGEFDITGEVHYYFVIHSSNTDVGYKLGFFKPVDCDNPPIKQTIEVNRRYESCMTPEDFYEAANIGPYEAFNVSLEKNKKYVTWLHAIEEDASQTGVTWSTALFHPAKKTGNYENNSACYNVGNNNEWLGMTYTADTTAVFTFFNAIPENLRKDLNTPYEFKVTEVLPFSNLMDQDAKSIIAPFSETGVFGNTAKYDWTGEFGFHTPVSQLTSDAGAYDAVSYLVNVPAGDTLFVEFGGSGDAMIHILDITDQANIHSYTRVDQTQFSFPYEQAYRVNTADAQHTFLVIGSFSDITMEDIDWGIQIGLGAQSFEHQIVSAVADKNTVKLSADATTEDALSVLGALSLSAVDKDKKKVCDITNDIRWWRVNFDDKIALYEVNNSDLPVGYEFRNGTEWIEVQLDIITGWEDMENSVFRPKKVMRDGVLYIITQHGTFNIYGMKVE